MSITFRKVKLPDGVEAMEREEMFGGHETHVTYAYLAKNGTRIDKQGFKLDYWGRIEGIKIIN